MNAERAGKEIERARRKPLDDAKLRELMMKLRKGATGTLTFGKLVNVLDALGWEISPMFGWSPNHYPYDGKEARPSFTSRSLATTEAKHAEMKAIERRRSPESPPSTTGERWVTEVGPIKHGHQYAKEEVSKYFDYREWISCEGVTVTTTKGESEDFLPNHHRRGLSILDDYPNDTIFSWAKKANIGEDLNAFLGTEAHIPAAQRTRENTGTCPACWGNFKLENGRLVRHWYRRPGTGPLHGQCFAESMEPIEISPDGAVEYQKHIDRQRERCVKKLPDLRSGNIDFIQDFQGRTVRSFDPSFKRLVAEAARQLEHEIASLVKEIELYDKILSAWRPRPLPKQDEMQRTSGFFLK